MLKKSNFPGFQGDINVVNGSGEKNMSLVRITINSRLTLRKPRHIPNPNHFYKFSNTTIVTPLT